MRIMPCSIYAQSFARRNDRTNKPSESKGVYDTVQHFNKGYTRLSEIKDTLPIDRLEDEGMLDAFDGDGADREGIVYVDSIARNPELAKFYGDIDKALEEN